VRTKTAICSLDERAGPRRASFSCGLREMGLSLRSSRHRFHALSPPSFANPFGTDDLGRDVFSRFVMGTRISFIVGAGSVFIAAALGIVTGLMAGLFEGLRAPLMRTIDAIWPSR